ncbi:MAG: hypothetical protein HOE02_05745 [Candidatus Marinimicrobia bacterium]|jgi:hypothetical protein|nr:hypothetical protein [Candidatus Neomarinimicrobiota bacterium]
MGQIIAYSGTHGTGKTTAAYQHVVNLKMAYPDKSVKALCDLEDLCPYDINKEGSRETQTWIFSNQINQELTNLKEFDIVVCDRTLIDVIGYTQALGFDDLAAAMFSFACYHIQAYSKIYCKKIINNRFCFSDGIRETKDPVFRQDVENNILTTFDNIIGRGYFPGKIYYN